MRKPLFAVLMAAAAVAIMACSSPAASTPTPAPGTPAPATAPPGSPAASPGGGGGAEAAVTVRDNLFAPTTLEVVAGTKVVWTNRGEVSHSVRWDDGSAGSDTLGSGGTYERTFTDADKGKTFAYFCGVHGKPMAGAVTVKP